MRTLHFLRGSIAAALLCVSSSLFAQQIQLSPVATGLLSPLFVGHAGDGSNRLFIVEQAGIIRVLQPGASTLTVFLDIRSKLVAGAEQGLLGLAFHPQYMNNGRFFVYYTRVGDGTLVIAEYTVSSDRDVASPAEKVILTIPHPTNTNHNGGMLAFGPDGYLYIGVGDGGSGNDPPNNAQNVNTLLGKILRIDVNPPTGSTATYVSPPDNPFFGAVAGRDEIFAYGMRNPWRFSFDRVTGQQWVGDVGQNAREEVDTPIVNGGNYGWRVYEGFRCTGNDPSLCDPAPYVFPIFDYAHINGRCSLTGGYVYRGLQRALPDGTYVYGDYCSGEIFAWDGSAQRILLDTTMNISSFGEDERGELYVVDLGGTVSRVDAPPPPAAWTFAANPSTVEAGGSSVLSFTTTTSNLHNVFISGQRPAYTCGASSCSGSLTVTPSATRNYTLTATNSAGTPYPSLTVTVTVNPPPPGSMWTFTANPSTITSGQTSVLSFLTSTADVHNIFINGQRPATTCGSSSCSGSLSVSPSTTTNYTLNSTNAAGTPYPALSVTVTVSGGAPPPLNVALAANGGVASASSVHTSGYPASAANNGDRKGLNAGAGGVWGDATPSSYPDWLQVDFAASYSITQIDVFTIQDAYTAPADPTPSMTFTNAGITAFDVQYWNGSAWVTVPGGSVTGNNKVWRTFTFPAITTTKIRVLVQNAVTAYGYITEVEAWASP